VEGVQHRAIAQQKNQRFTLVPLRRVDPKFLRLLQNHFLDIRSNPVVSAQNPGSGCNAYVGCECNFLEPYFAPLVVSILHIDLDRAVIGSRHSIKIPPHLTEIEGE
jgi:hypothetical protein